MTDNEKIRSTLSKKVKKIRSALEKQVKLCPG